MVAGIVTRMPLVLQLQKTALPLVLQLQKTEQGATEYAELLHFPKRWTNFSEKSVSDRSQCYYIDLCCFLMKISNLIQASKSHKKV